MGVLMGGLVGGLMGAATNLPLIPVAHQRVNS